MSWIAIAPYNIGAPRKTRLGARLDEAARCRFADAMAAHVLAALAASPSVARRIVLSPRAPADAAQEWRADQGGGLNAELAAARAASPDANLLVIHADLPFLLSADIEALLAAAAEAGAAYAPDRHGAGANAAAVRAGAPLDFVFGAGSAARYAPQARAVRRNGLAFDIDTPEDLDAALAADVAQKYPMVQNMLRGGAFRG